MLRRFPHLTVLIFGLLTAAVFASAVPAEAQTRACLGREEQRAAVASNKAIPLAEALRLLRARGIRGETVRASLCRRDGKLVYVLTLLARNGKVSRVTVDAGSGETIAGR
ncbi:MAG: hypothetical protein Q8M26_14975 [Pseudolabrys sp.]|nr:hypothetical protein [Pseudolabrys sp.]